MKKKMFYAVLIITTGFCVTAGNAASVPDGQIIIRIDDGASSRCINSTTDRITMNMRRLIIDKDVGFFTQDQSSAVIINTTLSGEEGGTTQKKVSFPRMFIATVSPYKSGYVSLPIEEKVFSRFPLTSSGNSYDTAELDFTVLAKKEKSPFGVALSALADISKTMPAPMNPFSEGFKYFSDYANKVVENSLTKENNVADSSKEGKVTLSFSSTGTCSGDQETTGTLAVVRGVKGIEGDGFVDIKKNYCWKAEFKPVFTLMFATPSSGTACSNVPVKNFIPLRNPHIAFYLNAEPKNLTASNTLQSKEVFLPKEAIAIKQISDKSVEKTLAAAYDVRENSSDSRFTTLKKVSSKTKDVLGDSEFLSNAGPGSITSKAGKVVILQTNATDSLAMDLAESFKRCSVHGITPDKCF